MNVSNLQLQGLYLAIAAVNNALVAKGVLTREEMNVALQRAEQTALGDDRSAENMTPSNRDALAFGPRILMMANSATSDGEIAPFSDLARMVGQSKGHYPDER